MGRKNKWKSSGEIDRLPWPCGDAALALVRTSVGRRQKGRCAADTWETNFLLALEAKVMEPVSCQLFGFSADILWDHDAWRHRRTRKCCANTNSEFRPIQNSIRVRFSVLCIGFFQLLSVLKIIFEINVGSSHITCEISKYNDHLRKFLVQMGVQWWDTSKCKTPAGHNPTHNQLNCHARWYQHDKINTPIS